MRGISFYVNFTPIGRLNPKRSERLNDQIDAACKKGEEALNKYWASDPFDSDDPRRHVRREIQNLTATVTEANTYWTPLGVIRLLIDSLERAADKLVSLS